MAEPTANLLHSPTNEQVKFEQLLSEWFKRCPVDALQLIGCLCMHWVKTLAEQDNPDLQHPVRLNVPGQPFEILVRRKAEEVKRVH